VDEAGISIPSRDTDMCRANYKLVLRALERERERVRRNHAIDEILKDEVEWVRLA